MAIIQLPEPPSREEYRKEYDVVASSWRFFSGLRASGAAFLLTLQSALFTVYLQALTQVSVRLPPNTIAFVGFLSVSALLMTDLHLWIFSRGMLRRGVELETLLGLSGAHFERLGLLEERWPRVWRWLVMFPVPIFVYLFIYLVWLTLFIVSTIG